MNILKKGGHFIIRFFSSSLPELPIRKAYEMPPIIIEDRYRMPLNWDELAHYSVLFSNLSPYTTNQVTLPFRRIFILKNGHITWKGVVFNNLKIFIPSLVIPEFESQYNGVFLLRQWVGKHLRLPEDVLFGLVYNHWASFNYYHWLIETLPRLILLRKSYPEATIFLPYSAAPYMVETVALLGFNNTFIIPENSTLKVPQLAFVERSGSFLHQDAELLLEAASSITSQVVPVTTKPRRRIYASRSRANCRKITNESDLLNTLNEYNFEVIYFEDYTFVEQVKIMRDVEVVIGLHGANLTNILFMQEETVVIELMNSCFSNIVYFQLASYLKLNYYILPCMPSDDNGAHNNADVLVDLVQMKNILLYI